MLNFNFSCRAEVLNCSTHVSIQIILSFSGMVILNLPSEPAFHFKITIPEAETLYFLSQINIEYPHFVFTVYFNVLEFTGGNPLPIAHTIVVLCFAVFIC